jgi:hypothetical protein
MDDLLKMLGGAARDDRARAPEGEEEVGALAPLDEAAREAMVEAALSALARPGDAPSPDRTPPSSPRETGAREKAPPAKVVPLAANANSASKARTVVARLSRWQAGAAAALAVAAALAFVLFFRSEGPTDDSLPAYHLSLSGSVSEVRGDVPTPSATAKVRPDSTLTVVLRPDAPTARALEARAFVEQGGSLRRVEAPVELSPEGAARLVARADRLFNPPRGAHRLVVAVGPRGALPEATSLEALRRARGVRVAEALVTVEGP